MEELEPGGALESVRQSIVKSAAAVRGGLTSPQSGGSNINQPNLATPSPIYSGSTYSRGFSMTPTQTTATNLPSLSNELALPNAAPDSSEPQMMHLLVCISGREYETLPKVRHLQVSDKWNDGMLLRELKRVYEQARQGRHWSVSLLLPSLPASFGKSSYVKSLRESQVLSSIRDSPVWEWLFRWAPDGGLWAPLYLPSTADFVKVRRFQNNDRHKAGHFLRFQIRSSRYFLRRPRGSHILTSSNVVNGLLRRIPGLTVTGLFQ